MDPRALAGKKSYFFSHHDNRYSEAIFSTVHLHAISICIPGHLDAFYIAEFCEKFFSNKILYLYSNAFLKTFIVTLWMCLVAGSSVL